jgi:predicted nucleic acid-binding protein
MLVVADSLPINVLIRIECVALLPRMFERVLVPPEVGAELAHALDAACGAQLHPLEAWRSKAQPTRRRAD